MTGTALAPVGVALALAPVGVALAPAPVGVALAPVGVALAPAPVGVALALVGVPRLLPVSLAYVFESHRTARHPSLSQLNSGNARLARLQARLGI
jgi:hypothetical protein